LNRRPPATRRYSPEPGSPDDPIRASYFASASK
jgi:hypothetical protein